MISYQLSSFCAPLARPIRSWFALALLLFVLAACGGEAQPTPTLPAGITVESGGMTLSGAGSDSATASTEAPAATATERPILAVGAEIALTGPAVLYAEPDRTAPRFAEYAAGSLLTVVEPDGDYAAYPVEVEGQRWYRVRAEDRMVGWVVAP